MPRDSSGNYSLPGVYNPVVPGSTITAVWANYTMSDIAAALTGSFCRDGTAPMTGPFYAVNGGVSAPGFSFTSEAGLGLYRKSTNKLVVASGGVDVATFSNTDTTVTAADGNLNLSGSADVNIVAGEDFSVDAAAGVLIDGASGVTIKDGGTTVATLTAADTTILSTGDITLDAADAILIDGASGVTIKDGGTTVATFDATNGALFPLNTASSLVAVTVYSSSGTHTTNSRTRTAVFEAWGGGGGGGGSSGASGYVGVAGGGGGGGYACGVDTTIESTYDITIGAAGSAGTTSPSSGGAGGNTQVAGGTSGTIYASANGGSGGGSATARSYSSTLATDNNFGGAGGTASGNIAGTTGQAGGTGQAACFLAGTPYYSATGIGGLSSNGGGGGQPGSPGGAGKYPGGGGAGGISVNGNNGAGGAGAQGKVIVWEFAT